MSLTNTELTALQTELAKPAYASYISAGNLAGIVQLMNAQTVSGDHFISSDDLWNALASFNGIAILLQGETSANTAISTDCQQALEVLRHSNISEYRYENSEIQTMVNGFVAAGLMTSAEVTQFQAAFTQVFTSVAYGILGRDIGLQDLWDYRTWNGI